MKPSRSYLRYLPLIALATMTQVAGAAAYQLAQEAEASSAAVSAVRFHVEPSQTRVWLETTGAVLYTHYSPDPLTLVIDLPGVDVSGLPERTVVGSREVESILATSLDGVGGRRLSRIEIKLATIAPYDITGSEHALNVSFNGGEAPEPRTMPPLAALEAAAPSEPVQDPLPRVDARPQSAAAADDIDDIDHVEEIVAAPVAEIREQPIAPPPLKTFKSHPASAISNISHELIGDVLTVRLDADGQLVPSVFTLDDPPRLVFDFDGILNEVPRAALTIEELGIARIRVAQYRSADPRVTRIVFDLDDEVTHRMSYQEKGLEIALAASEASFRPTRASVEPALDPAYDAPDPITDDVEIAAPPPPEIETLPIATLTADSGGAYLVRDASLNSEDGGSFRSAALTAQNFSLAEPAPMLPVPPPPAQDTGAQPVPTMVAGQSTGGTQYTGELISLDFKDGDIQDIFRLFAEISGLNIVVQPGVTGRITLKLREVPWDQALELILKTNRLGFIVEGNVIRIAPLAELANEESEKRRLAEEKALAGELFTEIAGALLREGFRDPCRSCSGTYRRAATSSSMSAPTPSSSPTSPSKWRRSVDSSTPSIRPSPASRSKRASSLRHALSRGSSVCSGASRAIRPRRSGIQQSSLSRTGCSSTVSPSDPARTSNSTPKRPVVASWLRRFSKALPRFSAATLSTCPSRALRPVRWGSRWAALPALSASTPRSPLRSVVDKSG